MDNTEYFILIGLRGRGQITSTKSLIITSETIRCLCGQMLDIYKLKRDKACPQCKLKWADYV